MQEKLENPIYRFWSLLVMKLLKYYLIFVYILQGKIGKTEKNRKENNTTKVTKRQKYGMNETEVFIVPNFFNDQFISRH